MDGWMDGWREREIQRDDYVRLGLRRGPPPPQHHHCGAFLLEMEIIISFSQNILTNLFSVLKLKFA
jgi:hypothetical protein